MADKLRLELLFNAVDKTTGKMKVIQKGSKALAAEFAGARKELAALNRTQGDINSFRKLKRETADTARKFQEATAKVAKLASEFKNAKEPTKAMERALAAAKREAGGLKEKLDGENVSLQRLRDSLKKAGVNTRDLAKHQRDLAAKVGDANRKLEAQKGDLTKKGMASAGGKGTGGGPGSLTDTAVAGGLIAGTMKEVGDAFGIMYFAEAEAEEQMTNIGIKASLSAEKLEKMRSEISRLAIETRNLPSDMRGGVDALTGFGLDPDSAMKMIGPIGKFSHAYRADMTDVSQATNAAVDNLKIAAEDTERVLDMMAFAGKAGAFEAKDLAKALPSFTANYAKYDKGKEGLAQLLAGAEIARKGAGNSEEARTNLENLLSKMTSQETYKNFNNVGIDLASELKKAKDPLETFITLSNKATGGDVFRMGELVQDQQVGKALAVLMANMEEYRHLRDQAMNAQGTVEADWATRAATSMSGWEEIKAKWQYMKENPIDWLLEKDKVGAEATAQGTIIGKNLDMALTTALTATRIATQAESQRIGSGIGSGILSGIEAKQNPIMASIARLGAFMQEKMRTELKINSPSRVFMKIAGSIPEGIAAGIDRGAHLPGRSLANINSGLKGTGVGGAAAPASGAKPGGAVTYNVAINLNGSGNAASDAQVIKRELDHLLAVDARTSYADA